MSSVEAVIDSVVSLALSPVQRESFQAVKANARLILPDKGKVDMGKELEKGVPWRFLNVSSGASLTLVTGLETILGAQDTGPEPTLKSAAASAAAPTRSSTAATSQPRIKDKLEKSSMSAIARGTMHRDMYMFRTSDVKASGAWDEGEIDYDVTQRDAMLMQSSLTKKTKTMTSRTLMTQKMRDEERRRKLASLPDARIRCEVGASVEIDDLVVQFDVPSSATLLDVYDIVRYKVLKSPEMYGLKLLDCTPPRKAITQTDLSVYEAGIWPAAKLVLELNRIDGDISKKSVDEVFAGPLVQRKGVLPSRGEKKAHMVDIDAASASQVKRDAETSNSCAATTKPGAVPKWFRK